MNVLSLCVEVKCFLDLFSRGVVRELGDEVDHRARGSRDARGHAVEFAEQLLSILETTGQGLYLLGSKPGVAELAAQKMTERHPDLRICGMHDGYFQDDAPILAQIRQAAPAVLFVCLAAPKQEQFMQRHQGEQPSVRLMIGLGGTLDSFAGTVRRAPRWMIRCNLEWLYRLIREPRRFRRMLRLPKYLWAVIRKRIRR